LGSVVSVSQQIVAGILYSIIFGTSTTKNVQVDVWAQSWVPSYQVTGVY